MTNPAEFSARTGVRLSLVQTFLIVSAIGTGVWNIRGQIEESRQQIASLSRQVTEISEKMSRMQTQHDSEEVAAAARRQEWWQWRWGVTQDLGTLSAKTSSHIITK